MTNAKNPWFAISYLWPIDPNTTSEPLCISDSAIEGSMFAVYLVVGIFLQGKHSLLCVSWCSHRNLLS